MLKPVQVSDMIERLAEHAMATGQTPEEIGTLLHRRYLELALRMEKGNQCATARRLGLHRNTIRTRIQALGIRREP